VRYIRQGRDPDVMEQMPSNMFIGKPPGTTDRILDFSTAVTGSLYFVPSAGFLDDPPSRAAAPASTEAEAPEDAGGSLGIGGLRATPR
jgi:putative iron-dependent peroxidase